MATSSKRTSLAYVSAVAVMVVWGTTFVSSKVVLSHGVSPANLMLMRFALAWVVMARGLRRRLWADTWRDEAALLGLGVMGGSLYFLLENIALLHTQASNVSILVCSCPLWTALLVGAVYRSERMGWRQITGSVLACAGMAMVVLNGQLVLHLSPVGDALALAAALAWTIYSLLITRLKDRYPATFVTRKTFAYGILTILPFVTWDADTLLATATLPVWSNVLYLGLVASAAAFLLWNWQAEQMGTVRASNFIYGQPVVTMVFSALLLGERITWMAVCGTAVLIAGMLLAQRK